LKILILGGTAEARELAGRLVAEGHEVVTSLAGRTQDPRLPPGAVRMGGFGGVAGLCAYLRAARIDRMVDATHPYAGQISFNAVQAAQETGVPLVRYMRPPWEQQIGDAWITVETVAEAAAALPPDAVVLLTTGHTGLEHFMERNDCRFVVRTIEKPAMGLPGHAELLQDRPPYSLDGETALMQRKGVTHLVSKNSGGPQTQSKLDAARRSGVRVIMIARPAYGPAREVTSVEAAMAALAGRG
jgi:precorrin-6A/cobalt-precorrin-6A reductase